MLVSALTIVNDAQAAPPTFQAAGTAVSSIGTASPAWPAHEINDVALLFVESTGGQAATLSAPAGFVALTNSPQATGAGTAGTRITVFWARATSSSMSTPTIADAGNHVYAQIITYRGVITTCNPFDITGGGVKAVASTSVTVTGVTTTVADTLIVQAVARDNASAAAQFNSQTNANLTSIAERADAGTAQGNGGGFAVWDGVMAAAGATGDTTANIDNSVVNAFLTIALKPPTTGIPAYKSEGTADSGTGTATPAWPTHAIDDLALLFVESAGGEAVTLSDAQGFSAVLNSPQATGAGTAGTRLSVFWARATSTSMAAPTVADPGNHVYAQILTYSGVTTSGDPWNVTGGGVKAVASTSVTVTGVTTTVANTLIVQAVSRDNDSAAAAFSAQTNATLLCVSTDERTDAGTASGNGGGFAVWDDAKPTAGATGDTTVTVTSSINAFLTIALRPPSFGAPNKLAFLQQPGNTIFNSAITPAVTVEIQDVDGNRVATATNSVTIAIGTNPAGGTLSGTLTVNAVAGVATFNDLSINNAGDGYTLTASSGGLTGATSNAFNITTGAYGLTQCAGSRFGGDLGCTANDVQITNISVVGGLASCEGGSTITVDLAITVNSGSPNRYDVGVFISNDGTDPQLASAASCTVGILPTTDPPFRNTDPGPWSGTLDICGDVNGTMNGGTGSGTFTIYNVNILCKSLTGSGGNLYIPFVVSWDQQSSPSGATCTSIANPVPGTVSKCNAPLIAQGTVNVVVLPTITKTDNKTTLSPGEITNYTVVISNTTGTTLTNVVFKDPEVTGLTANSVTCSGAACPCASCSVAAMQGAGITIPSLTNNSSVTFTINATVSLTPPATFTNTATATVADPAATPEADRTVSASDSQGGSGSGSGGSRVKIIKWREVFQ